jgi:hypothetical protein
VSLKLWNGLVASVSERSNRRFWLRWCWVTLLWVVCGLTPIVKGDFTGGWRVVGIVVFGFLLLVLVVEAAIRLRYRGLRSSNS